MRIEWDQERNVITIGKAVMKDYMRFQNSAAFANFVLKANDIPLHLSTYAKNSKDSNKMVADALGCSRSVLYAHFNKLQLKAFVSPVYHILKKVGYSRKGFSGTAIKKIHINREKLEEVYNDGLYNILPVVFELGKSPKELKKELKNVWKKLAKNSLNKNKHLMRACNGYQSKEEMLTRLNDIPTTVLKNFHSKESACMKYIANNFKGKWNKPFLLRNEINLFSDTSYLAHTLNEKVDPAWSPRRMKEEHDRMSKELHTRKYSKDVFESVKDIPVKELVLEEYKAVLLDNAFAIAEEGTEMGHCVGLYANNVRDGEYLVYSVLKNGERSSTIGINPIFKRGQNQELEKGGWKMQQHFGKYNSEVVCPIENEIAEKLIFKLNREKS